jgi:RNA polymerase sigma-70 factor (ECF subfamily)
LHPTSLIHEAYLRLVEQSHPDYISRAHFYGVSARVMRQILVDHARARWTG